MLVIQDTRVHRIGYDFYADIAEKIVEGRKAAGLTQAQLAKEVKIPESKLARYEAVNIRCRLADLEAIAKRLDTDVDHLIRAEYDDADCGECLYTVHVEHHESFKLYFRATSPQMAFLKSYEYSRNKCFRWFEARNRAIVELVGVPVKKSDYANKFKPMDPNTDDPIGPSSEKGITKQEARQ